MEQQTPILTQHPPPPPPITHQGWSRTKAKTRHFSILDLGGGDTNFPSIMSKTVFLYGYRLSSALRSKEIGGKMKKEGKGKSTK